MGKMQLNWPARNGDMPQSITCFPTTGNRPCQEEGTAKKACQEEGTARKVS